MAKTSSSPPEGGDRLRISLKQGNASFHLGADGIVVSAIVILALGAGALFLIA